MCRLSVGFRNYGVGRYLDFQLYTLIPRRVFRHNVNVLCARTRKVCKGNGLLGGVAGSTRHGGVYGRGGIAAFHDCIVIFARLVAGKLHRRGCFAVAGRAARCQRRRGGIAGNGKCNPPLYCSLNTYSFVVSLKVTSSGRVSLAIPLAPLSVPSNCKMRP